MTTLSDFARENQLTLTRFAMLLSGDRQHAEDVVQDVLTSMFRRFGDALPVASPLAYARAAVVNTELSRSRRRSSGETPTEVAELLGKQKPATGSSSHDVSGHVLDRQVLIASLLRLAPRSRAAIVLRYYLDLPVAQVAEALGCREGTAASLLSRAVATLRTDTALEGWQE
jgi:RNA polymerase sigma factor (sigma-70 family)